MPSHPRLLLPLLAALVALGPLSTDMYLAALPTLSHYFDAGVDQVQLTLSLYLVGFACAQLLYGPLSDRFGRKPILLTGLGIFTIASLGCAWANSIEALIGLRFLQAVGGSAGPVLGRAIVRDLFSREDAARMLAYIGSAMALAPALAPIIGGYLLIGFGWQAIFIVLAVYGVLGALAYSSYLGESLPKRDLDALHPLQMLRNYASLLHSPSYLGYMLTCSFMYAGLFAFISGSSFVFIQHFAYSEQHFGYFFSLAVIGYITGTFISGRYSKIIGLEQLLVRGAYVALVAGLSMAALYWLGVDYAAAIIIPMMVYMAGTGMSMPLTMAGAIGPYPHMAGSASALFGFVQMTLAALAGMLVGQLHDGSPRAMTSMIGLAGLGAWLAHRYLVLPFQHKETPE